MWYNNNTEKKARTEEEFVNAGRTVEFVNVGHLTVSSG